MGRNFALVGAAGYIAPRHMQAIADVGGDLVAAADPHDNVGVLDRHFPEAAFFTEIERFDRFLEKRRRGPEHERVHYLSVCSPNYLHDAHARLALRVGAHAICEKPVVISPWNLDALALLEEEYGRRVYPVLPLRLLPAVRTLRDRLRRSSPRRATIELTYVTPRGRWYQVSWKGALEKSGGLAMNIGIHLFDLLVWVYGRPSRAEVHLAEADKMAGILELEGADVVWYVSTDARDLPEAATDSRARAPFRRLLEDGVPLDLSDGFGDLHSEVYRAILDGKGLTLDDARPSLELSYRLRSTPPGAPKAAAHPWTYRGAARRADPAIEEARPIPRCAAGGRAAGEVGQPPGPADLKRVISRP